MGMRQFYARTADEERCRNSVITNQPITITGITTDGKVRVFSGTVRSVEPGHTLYPEYPLRITLPDSN
jgi:hypothetical protein